MNLERTRCSICFSLQLSYTGSHGGWSLSRDLGAHGRGTPCTEHLANPLQGNITYSLTQLLSHYRQSRDATRLITHAFDLREETREPGEAQEEYTGQIKESNPNPGSERSNMVNTKLWLMSLRTRS